MAPFPSSFLVWFARSGTIIFLLLHIDPFPLRKFTPRAWLLFFLAFRRMKIDGHPLGLFFLPFFISSFFSVSSPVRNPSPPLHFSSCLAFSLSAAGPNLNQPHTPPPPCFSPPPPLLQLCFVSGMNLDTPLFSLTPTKLWTPSPGALLFQKCVSLFPCYRVPSIFFSIFLCIIPRRLFHPPLVGVLFLVRSCIYSIVSTISSTVKALSSWFYSLFPPLFLSGVFRP